MALVHMKNIDVIVAQGAEHAKAPDPQDDLLTEARILVGVVKFTG